MINIVNKVFLNNRCDFLSYAAIYSGKSYKLFNYNEYYYDLYNKYFCKVNSNKTCHIYVSICNGKFNNIYYALKKNDARKVYVLDEYFNEIDSINLSMPYNYKANYECITYDYVNDKIILSHNNNVLSFTREGYFIKSELSKFALSEMSSRENIYRYQCNCARACSERHLITSVFFYSSKLLITYNKNNSVYIGEVSKCGNITNSYYIDDSIVVKQMFEVRGRLQLLVIKSDKYTYIYDTDYNIKKNYQPSYCCQNKNCKDGYNKIIESIALIETSIAEIIHSESEKINKGISMASDCKELLDINESASEMITNVTLLETQLKEKLKVVSNSENSKNYNIRDM